MPKEKRLTISGMVAEYCRAHSLRSFEFSKKAGVSTKTLVDAKKGEFDKKLVGLTITRRAGIAGSIHRLAVACGQDPKPFLEAVGLAEVKPNHVKRRVSVLSLPRGLELTQEDLRSLSAICAVLEHPVSLSGVLAFLAFSRQGSREVKVTKVELDYLSDVMRGMSQPLPLSMAIELLKRRNPESSVNKTP